jgi:hypothetical protein
MAKKKITTEEQYKEYFESHVHKDDCGCHLWTAAKNNVGYGFFRYHGKMQLAHRVLMKLQGIDIEGKMVYHTCDNYHCVNPDHLKIGEIGDKVKEVTKKGKVGASWSNPKFWRTCEHCGLVAHSGVIARLHNDKCKQKPV